MAGGRKIKLTFSTVEYCSCSSRCFLRVSFYFVMEYKVLYIKLMSNLISGSAIKKKIRARLEGLYICLHGFLSHFTAAIDIMKVQVIT
jgi:hypothetical protein